MLLHAESCSTCTHNMCSLHALNKYCCGQCLLMLPLPSHLSIWHNAISYTQTLTRECSMQHSPAFKDPLGSVAVTQRLPQGLSQTYAQQHHYGTSCYASNVGCVEFNTVHITQSNCTYPVHISNTNVMRTRDLNMHNACRYSSDMGNNAYRTKATTEALTISETNLEPYSSKTANSP